MNKLLTFLALFLAGGLIASAQTNPANSVANSSKEIALVSKSSAQTDTNQLVVLAERTDKIRNACISGRRAICGKVIKILPDGLVVDSGYKQLLESPFNQSWLVSGGASVSRDAKVLELNEPGAACIGPVFLTHFPKKPAVKMYDYVVIQGYPVGQQTYESVPGVKKTVRKFSAGLDTAIRMNLEAGEK